MTSKVLNRRDLKRPLITSIEDLPDFDDMEADEVITWWETHEVTPEVLAALPEGDLKADLTDVGLL
jgi:hypothetical protein